MLITESVLLVLHLHNVQPIIVKLELDSVCHALNHHNAQLLIIVIQHLEFALVVLIYHNAQQQIFVTQQHKYVQDVQILLNVWQLDLDFVLLLQDKKPVFVNHVLNLVNVLLLTTVILLQVHAQNAALILIAVQQLAIVMIVVLALIALIIMNAALYIALWQLEFVQNVLQEVNALLELVLLLQVTLQETVLLAQQILIAKYLLSHIVISRKYAPLAYQIAIAKLLYIVILWQVHARLVQMEINAIQVFVTHHQAQVFVPLALKQAIVLTQQAIVIQ